MNDIIRNNYSIHFNPIKFISALSSTDLTKYIIRIVSGKNGTYGNEMEKEREREDYGNIVISEEKEVATYVDEQVQKEDEKGRNE